MSQQGNQAMESLSEKSKRLHLVEFWAEREEIENLKARPAPVPFIWKWRDIHPHLLWASEVVPVEHAERRGLIFSNPGFGPGRRYHATQTLLGAYQLYNPGEKAPVHRHTPCASRFVISGSGGYTTVDGEKCIMERGDLIITPAGLWHDHGNEGSEHIIWMDVLDLPFVEGVNCSHFEFNYTEPEVPGSNSGARVPRTTQTLKVSSGYSERVFHTSGIVPLYGTGERGRGKYTPKYHYEWARTREALYGLRDEAGSPYEGVIVEYVDPTSGKSVMPNMSFRAQLLRPGEKTLPFRTTTSSLYCVLEGSGTTIIGDKTLEWEKNDVFVVPNWMWREHRNNSSTEDAVLYSVTDEPLIERAGLIRTQAKTADGAEIDLVPW